MNKKTRTYFEMGTVKHSAKTILQRCSKKSWLVGWKNGTTCHFNTTNQKLDISVHPKTKRIRQILESKKALFWYFDSPGLFCENSKNPF